MVNGASGCCPAKLPASLRGWVTEAQKP